MPRDTPPIALPAIGFKEASAGALRYGGKPRLPNDIDWPRRRDGVPMHFVAEIDLAALPHQMEQAGQHYEMPTFPGQGLLFFFLSLDRDMVYDANPVVVHAPHATAETPFRDAPEDTPQLDPEDAHGFHPDAVGEDGRSLLPGYLAAEPYLSARAENPLWRNMEREHLSEDEISARDKAYADQLNALGVPYDVPLPTPEAARDALYDDIPIGFQGFFQRGLFQWDWRYVFEVAKRAYAGCHDLPVEQLESWIEDGDDVPRYHRLIAKFQQKKTAVLSAKIEDRPGWWERFSCDHIPSLSMRFDVQLLRWMGYARVMHKKRGMDEADKAAFVALIKAIDDHGNQRGLANLRVLALFKQHRVRTFYVEQVLTDGFKETARSLQHLHPERSLEPQHDFGDADRAARCVQMFGAGYLLQHAAVEHEDKVLLFQLSDACGVEMVDGIWQLWITHEDLAAGRFDTVISTMEST